MKSRRRKIEPSTWNYLSILEIIYMRRNFRKYPDFFAETHFFIKFSDFFSNWGFKLFWRFHPTVSVFIGKNLYTFSEKWEFFRKFWVKMNSCQDFYLVEDNCFLEWVVQWKSICLKIHLVLQEQDFVLNFWKLKIDNWEFVHQHLNWTFQALISDLRIFLDVNFLLEQMDYCHHW